MNTKMTVIPTPCVPTQKDPTSAAVIEVTKGTAEYAQAKRTLIVTLPCLQRL